MSTAQKPSSAKPPPGWDLVRYRSDFPILDRMLNGQSLVYLDSAATSLKPRAVIEAVTRFYEEYTSNVHRAVHALAEEATAAFESAREEVARFINADAREVAFVRNATEGINVVAHSVRGQGAVAVFIGDHHSNLLPWRDGNEIVLELRSDGDLDVDAALRVIASRRPKLVALSTVNNVLGTMLPILEITQAAHRVETKVLLDISQQVGHEPLDVTALDCDFAVFSGHKLLGPSGIGVLYQRENPKDPLRPLLTGGSMVQAVHRDSVEVRPFPWCLEAGTPNIEGAIGLGAACRYLTHVGLERVREHGRSLTALACRQLSEMASVNVHGPLDRERGSIVSFSVRGMEAHGVARVLSNRFGILVRSGFHCAQPLHEACGMPESVRASLHMYNTSEEIDALVEALRIVTKFT